MGIFLSELSATTKPIATTTCNDPESQHHQAQIDAFIAFIADDSMPGAFNAAWEANRPSRSLTPLDGVSRALRPPCAGPARGRRLVWRGVPNRPVRPGERPTSGGRGHEVPVSGTCIKAGTQIHPLFFRGHTLSPNALFGFSLRSRKGLLSPPTLA